MEIEAFKFYCESMPDWFLDQMSDNTIMIFNCDYNRYTKEEAYCTIETLEGKMTGNGGDYIIKGVNGEIYPCKPDIFHKTYEKVE